MQMEQKVKELRQLLEFKSSNLNRSVFKRAYYLGSAEKRPYLRCKWDAEVLSCNTTSAEWVKWEFDSVRQNGFEVFKGLM